MPSEPPGGGSLADRLRTALRASRSSRAQDVVSHLSDEEAERRRVADTEQALWIADALGGWWQREGGGSCLVVDRDYRPDHLHGTTVVSEYAEALDAHRPVLTQFAGQQAAAADEAAFPLLSPLDGGEVLDAGRPCRRGEASTPGRLLFFDLETTGLSGGAGTCAFLIGCGWFDGLHFRTRQYFLAGLGHEAALLRAAARSTEEDVAHLVTYNGKTFDVPLIEGRYQYHRLESPFSSLAHVDLLHPARRLWRHRPRAVRRSEVEREPDAFTSYLRASAIRDASRRPPARDSWLESTASCALGELEEAVLGFAREGDVAGADIPARYFHYVRTGDVRPVGAILEHNRLDLLSLAALTSVVARMLEQGPDATRNAHECFALGRLYERSGERERAADCFRRAGTVEEVTAAWSHDVTVQREALRHLAVMCRRGHRHDEAVRAWERLLALPSAGLVHVEALEALAVHHEHRSRDLHCARAYAARALDTASDPHLQDAFRHRLARLDRKLGKANRLGGKAI